MAGRRMAAAGEGTPRAWQELGLHPSRDELGIVLGTFGPSADKLFRAPVFAAHPCIGQCSGDPLQLSVSVVWEVLLPLIFAARASSQAFVRVNLAEEQLKYPRRAGQFAAAAHAVAASTERLAAILGVPTYVEVADVPPPAPPAVDTRTLFGIFAPFQPGIDHPRGFRNEADILIAFTWYLARYRDLPEDACVVEGAHVAAAVRASLGEQARYLAALGLPAPSGRACLAQDAPSGERVVLADAESLPEDWWPEDLVRDTTGRGLRDLAVAFREGLQR